MPSWDAAHSHGYSRYSFDDFGSATSMTCGRPLVASNASWIAATRVGSVAFGLTMPFESSSRAALSLKNHVLPTVSAALLLSSQVFVTGVGGVAADPAGVGVRPSVGSDVAYVGIVVWQKPDKLP